MEYQKVYNVYLGHAGVRSGFRKFFDVDQFLTYVENRIKECKTKSYLSYYHIVVEIAPGTYKEFTLFVLYKSSLNF